MSNYDNTNRGVLFKNDRKDSTSQPDYKGNVNVDGVEYWLSAWIKEGAKGKFMSLSVTAKEQRPSSQTNPVKPARFAPRQELSDLDDDIPF